MNIEKQKRAVHAESTEVIERTVSVESTVSRKRTKEMEDVSPIALTLLLAAIGLAALVFQLGGHP